MKLSLTLTQRYILFLAGVIAAFIIGTQLITSQVVKSGLVEMFRQRFSHAQVVLKQYSDLHYYTHSRELESVLTSPRFLATLATEDSATIAYELPAFGQLLDVDFLGYYDSGRRMIFATDSLDGRILHQLRTYRLPITTEPQTDYVMADGVAFETIAAQVTTSDGLRLGWMIAGKSVSEGFAADLKQLTGLDVIVTNNARLIGCSASPLVGKVLTQPHLDELFEEPQILSTRTIDDEELIFSTIEGLRGSAKVMFIASLDEHISPIKSQITTYLLLFAAGGGLLAMLVIYIVTSRQIGLQVEGLVHAAEKIASGQMDFQVTPLSNDEFGYLAGEFEKMRCQIVKNRSDLENAHNESLRSERLAAIGKLATGIIHDFKSPMAVIRGTVELLQRKDPVNSRLIKYCETIQGQVDRMVDLTHDVIDFSRGESRLELAPVKLQHYFSEVHDFHSEAFLMAGVRIAFDGDQELTVSLDPHRFRRVVDNILNNAREALKPGDQVEISWKVADKSLALSIADNGPGIPENIKERLFEPFVTSNKEGGTGLGLAITRKIVEDHGGTIEVISSPAHGSRFVISLPVSLVLCPERTSEVFA
jgi:signal transduction histidine kinase